MQTATLQCPDATKALFAALCAAFPDIAAQLSEHLGAAPVGSPAPFPNPATLIFQEEEKWQTVSSLDPLTRQTKEVQAPTAPFAPLDQINRPTVSTEQAAYYLERRPQTLRGWACHEDGPLRPIRLNSRLHWRTEDIRRLLGVS